MAIKVKEMAGYEVIALGSLESGEVRSQIVLVIIDLFTDRLATNGIYIYIY